MSEVVKVVIGGEGTAAQAAQAATEALADRVLAQAARVGAETARTGAQSAASAAEAARDLADADAAQTAADRVQTGLDRAATGADRVATAADRVQTGTDRTEAAASAATATAQAGIATTQASAASASAAVAASAVAAVSGGVEPLMLPRGAEMPPAAFTGFLPIAAGAAYQIAVHDAHPRVLIAESDTLTWTLPPLAHLNVGWTVRVWNRSGNTLTIQRRGTDVIGAASTSITVADGTGAMIAYRDTARFERIA